jgi:hypothetical protein
MAADDRSTRSQPLVPAGSTIRHSFVCQTAPRPWFLLVNDLSYLTIFWIEFRIVCVTDDANS